MSKSFFDLREDLNPEVLEEAFSVVVPKQTVSGKTIGGGAAVVVKAKTTRQAITMVAKKLGVDWKMMKTGKIVKESIELAEAYQQFLDKSPSNWGEEKVVAYGTKKGYKVIGVCGHGKIDGIVLFGLDAGDKSYVGKEAKVKTGQTVFRYATRNSMAGDIFPLVKIDVKRGLLYNLSQKSSDGEVDYAEFESKSVKLRYLRLAATANLRDIVGFDPGFGSMKESVELDEMMAKRNAKGEVEMTKAKFAKVHKDFKETDKTGSYVLQHDGKKGTKLFPVKFVKESLDLEEGKMKEFHAMVKKGMTAAQIAKKIGMKEKDVADFMKGMNEAVQDCTCEELVITESEYQGKKVKLNDPIRTSENPNKKFKVYVKNGEGNVVVVRFGDPKMSIKRDDPKRRAAFRSRHGCDKDAGPKWKAKYWSCYQWRGGAKVDN